MSNLKYLLGQNCHWFVGKPNMFIGKKNSQLMKKNAVSFMYNTSTILNFLAHLFFTEVASYSSPQSFFFAIKIPFSGQTSYTHWLIVIDWLIAKEVQLDCELETHLIAC